MAYVLATTHDKVKWYYFNPKEIEKGAKTSQILDLRKIPRAANKATAKEWGKALNLKVWKYVKI